VLPAHYPRRGITTLWTQPVETVSTDEDERLAYAGKLILAVAGPTGLASGSTLGMLELAYHVRFYLPKLGGTDGSSSASLVSLQFERCESIAGPENAIKYVLGATIASMSHYIFKGVGSQTQRAVVNTAGYEQKYGDIVVESKEEKKDEKSPKVGVDFGVGLGLPDGAYRCCVELQAPEAFEYAYETQWFEIDAKHSALPMVVTGAAAVDNPPNCFKALTLPALSPPAFGFYGSNYPAVGGIEAYPCMDGTARHNVSLFNFHFVVSRGHATADIGFRINPDYLASDPTIVDSPCWMGISINPIAEYAHHYMEITPSGVTVTKRPILPKALDPKPGPDTMRTLIRGLVRDEFKRKELEEGKVPDEEDYCPSPPVWKPLPPAGPKLPGPVKLKRTKVSELMVTPSELSSVPRTSAVKASGKEASA
jgi:hypothetical protein